MARLSGWRWRLATELLPSPSDHPVQESKGCPPRLEKAERQGRGRPVAGKPWSPGPGAAPRKQRKPGSGEMRVHAMGSGGSDQSPASARRFDPGKDDGARSLALGSREGRRQRRDGYRAGWSGSGGGGGGWSGLGTSPRRKKVGVGWGMWHRLRGAAGRREEFLGVVWLTGPGIGWARWLTGIGWACGRVLDRGGVGGGVWPGGAHGGGRDGSSGERSGGTRMGWRDVRPLEARRGGAGHGGTGRDWRGEWNVEEGG